MIQPAHPVKPGQFDGLNACGSQTQICVSAVAQIATCSPSESEAPLPPTTGAAMAGGCPLLSPLPSAAA